MAVALFLCLGLLNDSARADVWGRLTELEAKKEWAEAIRLVQSNPEIQGRPETEFALGTLHLREGDLGLARAHLERANKLKPYDSDVRSNLEITTDLLEKKIGHGQIDLGFSWQERMADTMTADSARAVLGLLLVALAAVWLPMYRRGRNLGGSLLQLTRSLSGISALTAIVATGGILFLIEGANSHDKAILVQSAVARTLPEEDSPEILRIGEGVRVILSAASSDDHPQWAKIRLDSVREGFVPKSSLLQL